MNDPTPPTWAEWYGWAGMLAILAGYAATSFGWLTHGTAYQALNLFGAIGITIVCAYRRAWQPMALNVVWALVAASSLIGGVH